ncbi:MAG: helicase-related protein, partial [Bacteroidota bacterium]
IDELPPGRKEIKTIHQTENHRPSVIKFMRQQIESGRQIYVVYPLIEESATLDLKNLESGYEYLLQFFPRPKYQMSIVHGRMKPADKEMEMQRFVSGKTQILVATTVIEVGVDVPNATVMVIENTERFGLSQLHQLRGRVGRGGNQSFCVLMSGFKLSKDARERINIMVRTNNGFEISEADLELRGPGDIVGTRQSGIAEFKLVNLVTDNSFLQTVRKIAQAILEKDPLLQAEDNKILRNQMILQYKESDLWARIS